MFGRRWRAMALASVMAVCFVTPAGAAKPNSEPRVIGGGPPADEPWIPPSAEEQALIDAKLGIAAEVEANGEVAVDKDAAQASPQLLAASSICQTSADADGLAAEGVESTSGCSSSNSAALATYARRQNNDFYCGPATAQVIINRSRLVFSTNRDGENPDTNYRKQSYIATRLLWYNSAAGRWENTNTIGQTNAYMLRNGLNELAKLPSGFAYGVVATGTGSQWHSKVITDIKYWKMAFATPVKMTASSKRLASWDPIPNGVVVRHWLTIRGYNGLWDGTNGPDVFYNDSSGAQGGGTGSFVDPSKKVYELNAWHSARVVW